MAKRTHTHKGHCQACGSLQAASIGSVRLLIAKHGYTKAFGYFSGTCAGSDKRPVELDQTFSYKFAADCIEDAKACEETVRKFNLKLAFPIQCKTGKVWVEHRSEYKPVYTPWKDCTPQQQADEVTRQVDYQLRRAKHMRAHATFLKELAFRLAGQPLVENKAEAKWQASPGEEVLFSGRKVTVTKVEKVWRGGRRVTCAFWINSDGKEFHYPIRSFYRIAK